MKEMNINSIAGRDTKGAAVTWNTTKKIISPIAAVAAFLHSALALAQHDYIYALGLFGGACAWVFVSISCYSIGGTHENLD